MSSRPPQAVPSGWPEPLAGPPAVLRSILVALDARTDVTPALDLGLSWARGTGARIVGLGVLDSKSHRETAGVHDAEVESSRARPARASAEQLKLDAILLELRSRCEASGVPCGLLEEEGNSSKDLRIETQRHDLLMLVPEAGRSTGLASLFGGGGRSRGSLAERVIPVCSRPVVVVPDGKVAPEGPILCAVDGCEPSARALSNLLSLGLLGGRPVHVLAISKDREAPIRRAERAADFLRLHDVAVTPAWLTTRQNPGDVILEVADDLDASMIVLGAYGRSTGDGEPELGSVAHAILTRGKRPSFFCS